MNDLRTRPMTRQDAAQVTDLLAAAEQVDRTEEHYGLEDVLEDLANPMIEVSKDWLLVETEGRVVAHTRLMPRAPFGGEVSVALDGTVHPEHRGHGIGSRLVPLMIDRARSYVRERGVDLRPVVTGTAASDNTDLAAIFEDNGLRPHRWAFLMTSELGADQGPDHGLRHEPGRSRLPEGYSLHTWEGVEPNELREAHNRAFPGHPGFTPWSQEMWAQWVSESRNTRSALSLLLRDGEGRIAAYVQTNEYDAVAQATGIREAYIAKVGTLTEHRRRGLATALLQEALDRYVEQGFDRAALDVDSENPSGALGVYERAGFRTRMRWTEYELET